MNHERRCTEPESIWSDDWPAFPAPLSMGDFSGWAAAGHEMLEGPWSSESLGDDPQSRQRGRAPGECEAHCPDPGPSERDRRVREVLALALTAKQRRLVEAHFFDALSQGEIAEKFGISQQAVQRQLHGVIRGGKRIGGAIPKLRQALEPLVKRHG